jgi:hypothetical protein
MVRKLLFAAFFTFIWCLMLESEGMTASSNVASSRINIRLMAVIAVVAVSLLVSALLVSTFLASPQGQDGWLFKGAYATYEGSTSLSSEDLGMLSILISFDFNMRLEVLDFNSTHAFVSTSFHMSSSVGGLESESVEEETSTWVPLSEMNFAEGFEDLDLNDSYESTVEIAGFGLRTCTVYEYSISDEGLAMAMYIDKSIGWPLKMSISMTDEDSMSLDLDINLAETNIPALK